MSTYGAVQARVDGIQGWLRPAQARRLWDLAKEVPVGGTIVEIGSYQGKSTLVLASAAHVSTAVYAIDPHAGNDRGPGQWEGPALDGQADHLAFCSNLEANGIGGRVSHLREFSQHAQHLVDGDVDLLYVDGAHGYSPAVSDITEWGDRVAPGGVMAIHDVYTSLFVSLAVARSLWLSSKWSYVGRERSLAVYQRRSVKGVARLSNAARQMANFPWFVKNLFVRGLGVVGLQRLSRWGQHPEGGVY